MELVDVGDSKSPGSDAVPVRVRPGAPYMQKAAVSADAVFFHAGFSLHFCVDTASESVRIIYVLRE